jgi:hypothetical protein
MPESGPLEVGTPAFNNEIIAGRENVMKEYAIEDVALRLSQELDEHGRLYRQEAIDIVFEMTGTDHLESGITGDVIAPKLLNRFRKIRCPKAKYTGEYQCWYLPGFHPNNRRSSGTRLSFNLTPEDLIPRPTSGITPIL